MMRSIAEQSAGSELSYMADQIAGLQSYIGALVYPDEIACDTIQQTIMSEHESPGPFNRPSQPP